MEVKRDRNMTEKISDVAYPRALFNSQRIEVIEGKDIKSEWEKNQRNNGT